MRKSEQPSIDYAEYLQLDQLLNSQHCESSKYGGPAHDEMLFIITHQSYELWFKQILHELHSIHSLFSEQPLLEKNLALISSRLRRIIKIQWVINQQFSILETMTPLDFLEFRDYLIPASGFQSLQFREIERRLGLRNSSGNCPYGRFSETDQQFLKNIETEASLFDYLDKWLARMPFLEFENFSFWQSYQQAVRQMLDSDLQIIRHNPSLTPNEIQQQTQALETTRNKFDCLFDKNLYQHYQKNGEIRLSYQATLSALFIQLYQDEPILQLPFKVINQLMDIDAQLSQWRTKHALMVERMVGSKIGTGGSSGHSYLKSTIESKRIYSDLFNLSTFLIPRSKLPQLPEPLIKQLGFCL